jgi:hypothetical protein
MRIFDPQRKPEIAATIRTLMNNFGAAKHCGSGIQGQAHDAPDSRSRVRASGMTRPLRAPLFQSLLRCNKAGDTQ